MDAIDVLARVDMQRLRAWLGSVLVPTLVHVRYFEVMGFDSAFVRRFYRKHDCVLQFDGTLARNVRGVNEIEFLRGIAAALGVRPFEDDWDPRDTVTTMAVAQKCLDALAAIKSRQDPAASAMQRSDVTTETASSVVGESL